MIGIVQMFPRYRRNDNPHVFHPKTTIDHTIEYAKCSLEDEFPFAGECVGC